MSKLLIGIILTLFFLALCFFVEIPLQMRANAKVYPLQRWSVRHFDNGNIQTFWYNYAESNTPNIRSFQFERGDIVTTDIPQEHGWISKGDTLIFIRSFNLEIGLTRLKEALRVAKASLQVVSTGARNARVLRAQKELALAQQQFERAEQRYDRNKPLFEDGVVPESEFEQVTNQYELAKIQVEIAESQLLAAQTGRKPEEIALEQARISAIKAELDVLEQKADAYTIKAPFEGNLGTNDSINEILSIEDATQKVVMFPIPVEKKIFWGDSIHISYSDIFSTSVKLPERSSVYAVGKDQVVFVKLDIPGKLDISIGQWINCRITGRKVRLVDYLKHVLIP